MIPLRPAVLQADALRARAESALELLAKGGLVMIPIGICSIVVVAVAIDRFIRLRLRRVAPPGLARGLRDILRQPQKPLESALEHLDEHRPGPLADVLRAGIHQIPHGPQAVEKTVEDAAAREAERMRRSLRPLSAVAQLAPLLGLLGTIYGMITAFQAAAAAGVGKGEQLAAGIYEALLTTAAGLTVAIPALLVHQILAGRIDRLVDALEQDIEGVLEEVRLRARSREPRRSGP